MKLRMKLAALIAMALTPGLVFAQEKPAELKIGITTFISGEPPFLVCQPKRQPNFLLRT